MKIGRRTILKGIGGAALTLPVLEGLSNRAGAAWADELVKPFAIFLRQANGIAAAQPTNQGDEAERFWPHAPGPLTPQNVQWRTIEELNEHLEHLLVVGNVDMHNFNYADGHARGALQGLTARGPVVEGMGGYSEANGESLDHRIGAQLNPGGRDSLFLYAGMNIGWLGGACISYRGPGQRRDPLHNPVNAYTTIMGLSEEQFDELVIARQQSVNDMVREQLNRLLARPELSQADRERLDLHLSSIRELENSLSCTLAEDKAAELEGQSAGYDSYEGDKVLKTIRLHMDIAALAVACGYTRSVAIQVGNGNDGTTRYPNPETGGLMENYHYISHRVASHGADGDLIANADILHSMIDRYFAQSFKYLLDRLSEYIMPSGWPLLKHGVSVWYNDNGNGPGHSRRKIPYVIAGSAGGFLRQGEYIEVHNDGSSNHVKMLNTLGSAAGLRKADGSYLDDFGDPSLPKGLLDELLA